MRVALTGAHGLIGTALTAHLTARGHTVVALVRAEPRPGQIGWDPAARRIDPADLRGLDAVVHLGGAGIAEHRWTPARKQVLVDSRVGATDLLASSLAALDNPPGVLLSASAIGYYGDRGDEELTEASPAGVGFLAELCGRWEAATGPAEEAGIRVAHLRTGIVLDSHGGALAKMLPPFRVGLGGRLGTGRQYMSWVTLDDEVRAIEFALTCPALRGGVNVTAPKPVPNAELTETLGRVLHRPVVLGVPSVALRLAMGRQLADEMLLGGQRVMPAALVGAGFRFTHSDIEVGLRSVLATAAA